MSDTAYLQSLLDTREPIVYFPARKAGYTVSSPLRIHSGQTLKVDRFTVIRLAPGSNCRMLQNDDWENGNENIEVCGGIWDMQNTLQAKNPIHFPYPEREPHPGHCYNSNYFGVALSFFRVRNLSVHDMTLKDPVTFAIQAAALHTADFSHLIFDFNKGNPWPVNMDGVHLDGDCRFITISDLKGDTYDDLVALNADDGWYGAIEDVKIDGIFANEAHSALRMLSAGSPVRRVTVSNVYGRFYQYCVAFSKYFNASGEAKEGVGDQGYFEDITLENLYISKAPRYSEYRKDGTFVYPLIWFEDKTLSKRIAVRNLHRVESDTAVETVGIDPQARVEGLQIDGVFQQSTLEKTVPFLVNQGTAERCVLQNIEIDGDLK